MVCRYLFPGEMIRSLFQICRVGQRKKENWMGLSESTCPELLNGTNYAVLDRGFPKGATPTGGL